MQSSESTDINQTNKSSLPKGKYRSTGKLMFPWKIRHTIDTSLAECHKRSVIHHCSPDARRLGFQVFSLLTW